MHRAGRAEPGAHPPTLPARMVARQPRFQRFQINPETVVQFLTYLARLWRGGRIGAAEFAVIGLVRAPDPHRRFVPHYSRQMLPHFMMLKIQNLARTVWRQVERKPAAPETFPPLISDHPALHILQHQSMRVIHRNPLFSE